MKKSIVALLAASAVVALTGAGASAVGDFTLNAKNNVVAGSNLSVAVHNAKAGCDINVKLKDQTEQTDNIPGGTDWWDYSYTDNTVRTGNVKLGTKTAGSTTLKAPAQAGYYYLVGIVKLTKLSCVPVAGTTVDQYITVGTPVYVNNVNGIYADNDYYDYNHEAVKLNLDNFDLQTYNYELAGQVRTDNSADKPKPGVSVELWMTNIDGSRWVKVKTAKTNAFGEFKFSGVLDADAHYDNDYQIRITRDASFYSDASSMGTWSGNFNHYQQHNDLNDNGI